MILTRNSDIKLDRNRDHLKYYTMLFIAFLQGYFKQNDQGQFRWSDDLEQTEIVICDQDADLTDKYLPRIVTVRGPSSPLPMWFGDEGEPYTNATGAKKRTILGVCCFWRVSTFRTRTVLLPTVGLRVGPRSITV